MIIKRNNNYLLYRIAFTHIITLIAFFNSKLNSIHILIIWFLTAIFPNFILSFTRNLKAIEVKEDSICLIFSKYFKEVTEHYFYSNLKFTYKVEITGAKGARSLKFRIYTINNNKQVISIGGFLEGWTEDKISEIIEELNRIGIKIIE